MIITRFKPYTLKAYGNRLKTKIYLRYIFIFLCIITPFTNFLIPFILKYVKGHIYIIKYDT